LARKQVYRKDKTAHHTRHQQREKERERERGREGGREEDLQGDASGSHRWTFAEKPGLWHRSLAQNPKPYRKATLQKQISAYVHHAWSLLFLRRRRRFHICRWIHREQISWNPPRTNRHRSQITCEMGQTVVGLCFDPCWYGTLLCPSDETASYQQRQ
jgi:hypothetical protein